MNNQFNYFSSGSSVKGSTYNKEYYLAQKRKYTHRPASTLDNFYNRRLFQSSTSILLPSSVKQVSQNNLFVGQQNLFKKKYQKKRVNTINNQQDAFDHHHRSPLKIKNWQIRASAAVDSNETVKKESKKNAKNTQQNKGKQQTFNKIIEKLNEKQKLIKKLKNLANTPLPMRKSQNDYSPLKTYLKVNNSTILSNYGSLRHTIRQTKFKENDWIKNYNESKDKKVNKNQLYKTPKNVKSNNNEQEFKLQTYSPPLRTVYSPQISKSQYSCFENLKKTSSYTENLIKRQRDLKNVVSFDKEKSQCSKLSHFRLTKKLGQGKFGTVFAAIHIDTGFLFALKRIKKEYIKINMMTDQLITQIKIQSYCQHQNIVHLYDCFSQGQYLYLVLEYMQEGTLFDHLKKTKILSESQTASKIKQVTQALHYLHQKGIAHRDIKPENVVMSGGVGKLCDFGWAAICNQRRRTYCGTFDYAAPQILEGDEYDMSVDLWCLGVLAYELLVGKAPFYHISRKQTISKIKNVDPQTLSFPSTISVKAKDFISRLLRKEPCERMSAEQAMNHQFLQL